MPDQTKINYITSLRRAATAMLAAADTYNDLMRQQLAQQYGSGEANEIVDSDITDMNAANSTAPQITLVQFNQLEDDVAAFLLLFNTTVPLTPLWDSSAYNCKM